MAGLFSGLCTAVMSDESGVVLLTLLRSRHERSTLALLLVAQLLPLAWLAQLLLLAWLAQLLLLVREIGIDMEPLGVAWPSEAEMTTPATEIVLLETERTVLMFRGLGNGPPKASKRCCDV